MTTTASDVHPELRLHHDHNEITDLVYRLGACLDESRFDDLRQLVVEDATVRTPAARPPAATP
jgi:hypothetical protein